MNVVDQMSHQCDADKLSYQRHPKSGISMLHYNYKENQKSCTKYCSYLHIYRFTYTSVSPEFLSLIAAKPTSPNI